MPWPPGNRVFFLLAAASALAGCSPLREMAFPEKELDILRVFDRVGDQYDLRAIQAIYGDPPISDAPGNRIAYASRYIGPDGGEEIWYLVATSTPEQDPDVSVEVYLEAFAGSNESAPRRTCDDILRHAQRIDFKDPDAYNRYLLHYMGRYASY